MEALLEPFQTSIGRRALAEVVLLGLACGPLGAWVVLHRQSYAAESLSHGMLPGLVLAALAGIPLVLGALGGVLVAAAATAGAGRDARLGVDTGVAVAVTGLLGAGSVLALSPSVPARLDELLFGDPLGITSTDLALAGGLAMLAGMALAAGHRPLTLSAFDRAASGSLGWPAARSEVLLLITVAVVTAAAAQALGSLLAVALVLGPGAAGVVAGHRIGAVLGIAAAAAVAGGVAGLQLSHHLEVAAGAAIALCALTPAIIAWSLGAGRR